MGTNIRNAELDFGIVCGERADSNGMDTTFCRSEQIFRTDAKSIGNLIDLGECNVLLAAFDVAQIAAIQVRSSGERFLRKPLLFSDLPDFPTKCLESLGGHE